MAEGFELDGYTEFKILDEAREIYERSQCKGSDCCGDINGALRHALKRAAQKAHSYLSETYDIREKEESIDD